MIQVLNRAFDILELVALKRDGDIGLGEIADSLGLNHGTCANIIKTMIYREYLEKTSNRGGYKLGSRCQYLTGNFPFKKELLSASVELMKDLSTRLDEGVILAIIQDNKRVLLHEEKCRHELQVVNHRIKELYRSSTGRIILACKSKQEQEEFIKKYGIPDKDYWPGIDDEEDFYNELKKIAKRQMAIQIAKSNVVGVAVPIFINNEVVASLGVYLPETRFTMEMQENISREIQLTAIQIMQKLELSLKSNSLKEIGYVS